MQHLQRTHGEDAVLPALTPGSGTVEKGDDVTIPNGESAKTSESGESACDDMETFTPDSSP